MTCFSMFVGHLQVLQRSTDLIFWFKVFIRTQNATNWDTTYVIRLLLIWFFHYSFHTMHRYSVEFYVRVMHVRVSADDTGLGKTLTMIALVVKAKEEIENEGVSEEDEENESSWYSEKQTCKYYCTFLSLFHFLQFYHLHSSQSISILPELISFFPCSCFLSCNTSRTYIFIFSSLTVSFSFFIFQFSFVFLFLFCLETCRCLLILIYISVPFKSLQF
jgi:hypothetical protein